MTLRQLLRGKIPRSPARYHVLIRSLRGKNFYLVGKYKSIPAADIRLIELCSKARAAKLKIEVRILSGGKIITRALVPRPRKKKVVQEKSSL